MATYPIMVGEKAQAYLHLDPTESQGRVDSYIEFRGDGERSSLDFIDALRAELEDLRDRLASKYSVTARGSAFESLGAELVHRSVSTSVPLDAISDPDFWTWVTVANFSDLVEWRFRAEGERARMSNYGVHNAKENLVFRMWLRGEIGYDETLQDPYELAKAGDQDLWRSHIVRQGYGNVRGIARSLLRLQSGKLDHPKLGVNEVRELAKRIKRLRANVMLEALTPAESDALVLELTESL